jgi:hypothetical protein
MPTDPQSRVRAFRREASYSHEPYATCIVHAVNGSPHAFDVTITQAKALNLELSRAILEHEAVEGERLGRVVAAPS